MSKYLLPRIGDILFISLLTVVLLYGPRTFHLDGDLGRHITIGNHILDSGSIPKFDLFSHTMLGQPLTPHEWLAQTLFALAHRALSLAGTVLITALIIACALTWVFYDGLKRGSSILVATLITILAAATTSLHWLARPHVFTFLFLAIWVTLFERIRSHQKTPIWLFGLVMLLWANTHGAFIAGFVIWGAYYVGEIFDSLRFRKWDTKKLKTWGLIGIFSLITTFLNPAGIKLWETSFGFVGNRYLVSHTQEYLPPFFHNPSTWPFLIMLTLMIFLLGTRIKRLPFAHIILLSGWSAMGLYSARNIPLYAIVAVPILSSIVTPLVAEISLWQRIDKNIYQIDQKLRGGVWILAFIMIMMVFVSTPAMQMYNTYNSEVFPVEAVDSIEKNPLDGNVFNHFSWGGYLLYRKWPETLVFIDGQTDFYGETLTREYENVISLDDNWEQILAKYQVTWILIPKNSTLASALLEHPDWENHYTDNTATIFTKNP